MGHETLRAEPDVPAPHRDVATPRDLAEGVLAQVLGYQVTIAEVALRRLFVKRIGKPLQLKPVEYTVLLLLLVNQNVSQKLVGQALAVSAPKLTIVLDRLEKRGLVQRVRSESDRRAQQLLLTRKGQALARKAEELSLTMERDFLHSLSAAERAMLIELLRKVGQRPT